MTHLVLISTSYPDKEPGSEAAGAFVADFAMELSLHVRITVLAPARHNSTESAGNLTIQRFAVPRLPLSLLHPGNPLHWCAIVNTLRAGSLALGTLATQTSIDHILALWALPSGYWALRTGARHGIPYSCWSLGSDIWSLGRVPVVRSLLRHVLRKSYHCYADGYQLKRDVEAIAGRSCEFLPSMRRLISDTQVSPRQSPPYRLAFLGRFHPNKGVDLLFDALDHLNDDAWSGIACVRIAGGGPLQGQIEERVGVLRQQGRSVELEGYKDRGAAMELLDWCDFVLIPSRIESIPVIFSDAMQLGKPVIAMPVGDLPELINRHDVGLVCRHVTSADYAELLTPLSLATLAGKRSHCRSAADDFNLTRAASRLLSDLALIDV